MGKKISLWIMIAFYVLAGINHFWHPTPYYALIPDYLPWHHLINITSGAAEIIFGVLLIISRTRKIAAYSIIAMLIAFIPAHIVMIQNGWCTGSGFCLPPWATWIRLFPLQFLLIWWAWTNQK